MTRRRRRRFRRPAVRTLEDFSRATFGFVYGGAGYARDAPKPNAIEFYFGGSLQAARDFWATYRAEFLTMRRDSDPRELRPIHHAPGRRPWLWWFLDSPERPAFDSPYCTQEAEYKQLKAMGEIREEEREALRAEAVEADAALHGNAWHNGRPFRRSWQWWEFCAPAPRDASLLESAQLTRMRVLTDLERAILSDPVKAVTSGVTSSGRTRFYYLPRAERQLLGIDAFHNDPEADGVLPAV